jgi:hypothetical protein
VRAKQNEHRGDKGEWEESDALPVRRQSGDFEDLHREYRNEQKVVDYQ